MIIARTVIVTDPLARANVVAALTGSGAPGGITTCVAEGETIAVAFDAERTTPQLIDALIALESELVPARVPAVADAAAVAATGLNDPELDATRLIETYLS